MSTTKIAALRKERGLTQKDLALRLKPKTSDVQISRLESEDRRLTLAWMRRIANGLQVKVSDLLPDEDVAPPGRLALSEAVRIEFRPNLHGMSFTDDVVIRLIKFALKTLETQEEGFELKRELRVREATE